MNKTNIEYLDYSWNPTHGCSPISPGCDHCWAKITAKRIANMGLGARGYSKDDPFKVTCCPWKLDEPFKIKKPSRLGVSFMGDLFHEDVPTEYIEQVFQRIYDTPEHTYLILTKRPDRLKETRVRNLFLNCFMNKTGNIWLGITAENQGMLDKRIEIILEVKKLMQTLPIFVSIEPMLGAVDISEYLEVDYHDIQRRAENEPVLPDDQAYQTLDWVIVGAESGLRKRYCDPHDMIKIVNQCKEAGVPVFVKQIHLRFVGDINRFYLSKNMDEWPEDLRVREYPG